ncbi:hypothetical protein BH11BAC2_BH11BAC2_04350 [soil metagenome]
MKYLLNLLFILVSAQLVQAQTFIGGAGVIPDDGTSVMFPITVSGLTPTTLDSTFGLESVCINIIHPYDSDLDIWLVAPDGTYIELSTGNGGSDDSYITTCFNDMVSSMVTNGTGPFNGTYHPEGFLSNANNGQNPNGDWNLFVHDTYPFADAGLLLNWNITFGTNPAVPFVFPSSNLPIIKISTLGQVIVDNPKISCTMKVIDNGAGIRNNLSDTIYAYDGNIGIEIRGSSSQGFPKKSFGFETRDTANVEMDFPLLGLPTESDWILNANYTDKTLLRNVLAYDLSQQMGYYASRHRFCEVFINGNYQGVYILMEKIKRDVNRVNISKLTAADTTGDDLTGGYILKIDKATGSGGSGWQTLYPPTNNGPTPSIQYEYPDPAVILPVQQTYIHDYVDSFEIALNGPQFSNPLTGYQHFIETQSFIDYFLLNELSRNVDGYRISTFFYKAKDSKGGKLHMGPVWDYDIAFGNADYYNGNMASGWSYILPTNTDGYQVPFWWDRFLQDSTFSNDLRCRWNYLRSNVLSTPNLYTWIDSMAVYLDESQQRNFTIWPILGVYVWPNPSPIPTTYQGVINELKNFVSARASWLDTHLPSTCATVGLSSLNASNADLKLNPNPASVSTELMLDNDYHGTIMISLYNVLGEKLSQVSAEKNQEKYRETIALEKLQSGIYLIVVQGSNFRSTVRMIKQ